ncbi:hypothetical protein PILCRDRAFT_821957 [Piloderma croceum F 1598]|uniref:Mso1 N-terminal domain-containing protein n=1 Tax=Piloderma croceum (strain F 1598) TaxID=765440 RepID=A0A0C3BTS0_PILCF|nr:hypothetical protein PILCRDRAFT_821957 [Piloderma croceum F 1598]
MLPNHPSPSRSRVGLPTAPRSRSVGRARQDELSNSYSREQGNRPNGALSSRQVRSQRSMASLPPAQNRYDAPPTPQPRQAFRSNKYSRTYGSPSMVRKESDSLSSMSSTASSFLDKLRGGGDTSSNTSLEEDYELSKRRPGQESKLTRQDSRSYEENREDSTFTTGVGYALWSRLASVAGTLSVDVGKAWATNVAIDSSEDTPPGEESRLTRAMKAYYIERARDLSDLPEWLFEEHERRPAGRSRFASRQNSKDEVSTPASRSRGLRDIYDAAAAPPSSTSRPSGIPENRFADEPAFSKTTNRLKALRDAKRQNSDFDGDAPVKTSLDSDGEGRRDGRGTEDKRPRQKVGLPSGPGGGRSRI